MLHFIFILCLIFIAIMLGLVIQHDPGYVLLSYGLWSVEMPLWLLLLMWFASLGIGFKVIQSGYQITRLPKQLLNWRKKKRIQQAYHDLEQGLLSMLQGNWRKAAKQFNRNYQHASQPVLHIIGCALAYEQLNNQAESDRYLNLIDEKHVDLAHLARAGFAYIRHDLDDAFTHLKQLEDKHLPMAILLSYKSYYQARNYAALQPLLPSLKQQHQLDKKQLQQASLLAQRANFRLIANHASLDSLDKSWSALHEHKWDLWIIQDYVDRCLALTNYTRAETILRKALQQDWQHQWLASYGDLPLSSDKAYKQAQRWLKTHPDDPALLLCLGKQAYRLQLWEQAKTYLQDSVQLQPNSHAYFLLGKLLLQLHKTDQAISTLLTGLEHAQKTLSLITSST